MQQHNWHVLTLNEALLFSIMLWGKVSGLSAGGLINQFGFSSTRHKVKRWRIEERKRVGMKRVGTFRILIKIVWGNPTLPHLEQDSCAERKLDMCDNMQYTQQVRFGCCRKTEQLFRISESFTKILQAKNCWFSLFQNGNTCDGITQQQVQPVFQVALLQPFCFSQKVWHSKICLFRK